MASFDDQWAAFEEEVGPLLADEMSLQSPVDTGQLADSHSWQDDAGELQIVSTDSRGPIAAYVIGGTGPHPIDPLGPWPLHFFVDGEEVYAYHVDHPGTAPNPYNQVAWQNQQDDVLRAFRDIVGVGTLLAYLNPWVKR